jgi:hypothetical protein
MATTYIVRLKDEDQLVAVLVKKWADGAEIETKDIYSDKWRVAPSPQWYVDCEYRVKPEPKPDVVVYSQIYDLIDEGTVYQLISKNSGGNANIKYTFDGETGGLKSAEVISEGKENES